MANKETNTLIYILIFNQSDQNSTQAKLVNLSSRKKNRTAFISHLVVFDNLQRTTHTQFSLPHVHPTIPNLLLTLVYFLISPSDQTQFPILLSIITPLVSNLPRNDIRILGFFRGLGGGRLIFGYEACGF